MRQGCPRGFVPSATPHPAAGCGPLPAAPLPLELWPAQQPFAPATGTAETRWPWQHLPGVPQLP